MLIYKKSVLTGRINQMDIPVTTEMVDEWQAGNTPIQDFFPHLNADQREFLLTGSTPEEWDEAFGEE